MVQYYVYKITHRVINPKTGKPWTVEDVPRLWREAVREYLENEEEE